VGTSRTTADFLRKIDKLGTATDRSRQAVVNEGAFAAKRVMLASAAAKGWHPGSKIAGRGWNVSYSVRGTTAVVRYTGPFHLVNNPTKAHRIEPGRRRGRKAKALNIGGNPRAYAFHPGTRGKRIFQAAKVIVTRSVPNVMATSMKGAWRRALR
jgi:hypothetical protein